MAEFSKLNGYDVKDATARQQIADMQTEVNGKVKTADIVDNLTSDAADKPLSAKQGKALDGKITDLVDNHIYTLAAETYDNTMFYAAISAYDAGYTIVFIDSDGERCNCVGHTAELDDKKLVFFKASTNSLISLAENGETETTKIDKAITTSYDETTESLTISE